ALADRFRAGEDTVSLVRDRADLVDSLIKTAWRHCCGEPHDMALAAVGGYGRGELHPHSDVDIVILVEPDAPEHHRDALQRFLALLWDIGLHIGHSVRTVADCQAAAAADITIATNLMESRLLIGPMPLFAAMRAAVAPEQVWPASAFFEAKWREQRERHAKYEHTAYKLEPNVKEGPGGLRDIQTIVWVAQRHFGTATMHGLVEYGFLTENEFRLLTEGQAFLWRVRFALHLIAGRREDRLLFDHQLRVARLFGYEDREHLLGVEQFMQHYYRTLMSLSRLNEMLLQLFQEALLLDPEAPTRLLDEDFQVRHRFLEVRDDDTFRLRPRALMRLFLVLEQHPDLKGVSARTIRLIRRNLDLIDDTLRADPQVRACFMAILREPQGLSHELRRMNHYGVLGRYLPAFGEIVGRMQYDLFHAYTVDEHILFVVGNLRSFALARHDHEFPLCSRIMQTLDKPEVAYLAGLFHDIAKGRGGDHSTLGAVDAEQFCIDHGLSRYDARLVSWLVTHHLSLSVTAQKKDINDPAIINDFASLVGDQIHLDLLYMLTVADVRATNPSLWNSWKASLFGELYANTQRALRRGLENPIDKDELIDETQSRARALLATRLDDARVDTVWRTLTENYFLQHTADEIAWHTEALAERDPTEPTTIMLRADSGRGGTAISVYAERDEPTFGRATAALDQLGLTIVDARIVPVGERASVDTYVVLEDTGEPIDDPQRLGEIAAILKREIGRRGASPMAVTRRAPRQVRMFSTSTGVTFTADARNRRTVMEITAGDRPGLLSEIGRVLEQQQVRLQNAKITTVGERAEDVFFVNSKDAPLDEAAEERLRSALLQRIGSSEAEKAKNPPPTPPASLRERRGE
ncbi:MAG TPA: [protein-PII] uridylyltransferase, partial [Gammaproteobacteria bacterium]|nr:[protein-PII] uridylyltransferase [Gammaproteobacteria bacterium]